MEKGSVTPANMDSQEFNEMNFLSRQQVRRAGGVVAVSTT